jgi:hypothetical protein
MRGILVILIFVGLLIPGLSFMIWKSLPFRPVEIVIVNKTVPNGEHWEHQSFFWLLNHLKLVHSKGDYLKHTDYYGYKPGNGEFGKSLDFVGKSSPEIREIGGRLDHLYFIDTYGVYERDLNPNSSTNKKLYGGMVMEDLDLIKSAIAHEKTVIVEFNTIANPTSKTIRKDFEQLMGIQWSGWIARYFDELDKFLNTDIPEWILSNYIEQHGDWDFKGKGVIFIGEKGAIEVFTYPEMINHKVPLIFSPLQSQEKFALPPKVAYPHWIEINRISKDYEVISYYDLQPSQLGLQKLENMGLPRYFPATVRKSNGRGHTYYFSGDFAGHSIIEPSHRFFAVPWLWRFFYSPEDYSRRDSFFWQYYFPLMKDILKN